MNKKSKGFSLAELLISLLIISIVLSAAIPTLTKRSSGSEQIWRWSSSNNSAYFGMGALQSAIIGNDVVPDIAGALLGMDGISDSQDGVRFTNSGDKLVLLKQSPSSDKKSHLENSHISFYTLANNAAGKTNDVIYTGRLTLERHNIALGIGSLQSLDDTADSSTGTSAFLGQNTAIGHFTLYRNKNGKYNTAVGESSLANYSSGSHNTALGYQAGISFVGKGSDTLGTGSMNTSIGSQSLRSNKLGNLNTALGFDSLKNTTGSSNIALGSRSCRNFTGGSFNICMGYEAGYVVAPPSGDDDFTDATFKNKVAIQADTANFASKFNINNNSSNLLFIGSSASIGENDFTRPQVPLIFGRTQYLDDNNKRYLGANTYRFAVNTFNGLQEAFSVTAGDGKSHGASSDVQGIMNLYTHSGDADTFFHVKGDKNSVNLIADDKLAANGTYRSFLFNNGRFKLGFSGTQTANNGNLTVDSDAAIVDLYDSRIRIEDNAATKKSNLSFSSTGNLTIANGSTSMLFEPAKITIKSTTVECNATLDMKGFDINMTGLPYGKPTLKQDLVAMRNDVIAARSDIRAKNVIGDNNMGLNVIKALDVKNYTYKDDKTKTKHVGVIAQQLQKLYPDAVLKGDDGYLRVKREELFFALLNSVKELFNQLQDLTAKVVGLDKRIDTLEQENALLKKQNEEFEKRLERLEKKI